MARSSLFSFCLMLVFVRLPEGRFTVVIFIIQNAKLLEKFSKLLAKFIPRNFSDQGNGYEYFNHDKHQCTSVG